MMRVFECKPHRFATVDVKAMDKHLEEWPIQNPDSTECVVTVKDKA